MAKIVIDTELNTKSFDRQIQKLKTDIERYMRVLESDAKVPVKFQMSASERQEIETTIEKLRNQLIGLEQQAKKTGEVGEVAGEQSGRGFERGITSLKRFALSLFGIRSAFSLVRRATSTYLSQHEDTANKINAIWVALGNALAPIIEALANMVLKFIGYLNVFLQALGFDVDLTKGMNKSTKAIGGTTKAMKELNNQVASFDEMNVAQKETSSGGAGGGGGIGGTNGFTMPELDPRIVGFLQDCAKYLKENWDWISKILLLVAGIKIAKWLTGLGGLAEGLGTLATIGVVVAGVDLIYNAITGRDLIEDLQDIYNGSKQLKDLNDKLMKQNKNDKNVSKDLIKQKEKQNDGLEAGNQLLNENFDYLRSVIEQEAIENKALATRVDRMSGVEFVYNELIGTVDDYDARLNDNNETIRDNVQAMVNMYEKGQLTEDQEKKLFEILGSLNATIEDGTVKYKDMDYSILQASHHTEDYQKVVNASNRELSRATQNSKQLWSDFSSTVGTESDKMKRAVQGSWYDIGNVVQTEMQKMSRLRATPTVDIQVKTSKLSSSLEAIKNDNFLTSLGLTKGLSTTIARLRSIGMARGGIFYNPGRGVSMTNVLVGEATGGAEGVVPLNNEQSMDLIGQSIARHLVVNLTNTTMLDSKVIAREQRRIEDENNFATNGRGVL